MKKILLLNLLLAMLLGATSVWAADGDVVFNSTNFPDPAFRQYLSQRFDFREGQTLKKADCDKVKSLNMDRLDIYSLKGIEYFTSISLLFCNYNHISVLDLSNNKNINELYCAGNNLTSLDISMLRMGIMNCSDNKLISLVLGQQPQLYGFSCQNNSISTLDLSSCHDLTGLNCSNNNLSALDLTNCPEIHTVYCSNNNLSTLNLSYCPKLKKLQCANNKLNNLNVGINSRLVYVDCSDNQLTFLYLKNNTYIINLYCANNDIPSLDVTNLADLEDLDCSGNSFTSLDISYNTKLQRLTMKNSKVTSLDQSFCPDLHYMNCKGTPLGRLRILNNNKEMDTLIVKNCNLDVLTLSDGINKMKHLDCSNNNIGALSLSNMPELLYLDCSNNRLPSLDITSCKSLKRFFAHHNRLISIGGVDVADGPNWENYDADAFTPQEPTTRRFERVSYNGGEAWALYLGISDASRILNFKKDDVAASPVISNKYLIVSDNLSQIPQKVEYDFKPYATKNAFHVVVNYDVKDYNIFVDGQKMTSLNFFDIPGLVSGKAYFEDKPEGLGWAGEPTLVLDNATLEWDGNNYGIYNNNNYYFTIKVIGDCSVTSKNDVGIELDPVTRTTIEGGGTLNIFSKNTCIESFVLAELTIQDNTKIIGRSTDGRGYYEGDVAKLEIKDGAVFAVNSKYEPLYLDKDKPVFGEGIDIRYPEGAYFSGTYNNLYYADGTEVKNDWVVFGPENLTKGLGFFINDKEMTRMDMHDLLDDVPGVVSGSAYIEENEYGVPVLVLDNAMLKWDTTGYGLHNHDTGQDGLTIKVLGDCTIKAPNAVAALEIDVANMITIEGGGTLNIISGSYPIETWVASTLRIQDATTVIAKSETGRSALWDQDGAYIEIMDGGVFAAYSKYEPIWLDSNGEFIFGEGIALRYPVGAYVGSGNNIYNADGTKVTNDWVVIGPDDQKTKDLITASPLLTSPKEEGQGYNLAGQKVGNGYRGIVIKDGKKMLIK